MAGRALLLLAALAAQVLQIDPLKRPAGRGGGELAPGGPA
jgi:hypothetical protein